MHIEEVINDRMYNRLLQVCKLFRHIATTEPLVITAEHNEMILRSMGPLVHTYTWNLNYSETLS